MAANPANDGPQRQRRRAPLAARRPAPVPGKTTSATLPKRPPEPAGLRDSDGQWLPLAEAAQAAGVSPATLRRWRKEGTIAERRSPDEPGTIEVFLATDDGQAATVDSSSAGGAKDNGDLPESGVLVPLEIHQRSLAELILRLTDTTERAVRAEARVEMLEAQLAERRPPRPDSAGTLAPPSPRRRK
jgi:transposase-like protein